MRGAASRRISWATGALIASLLGCDPAPSAVDRAPPAAETWEALFADVRKHDWPAAHARMVELYRRDHDVDAFRRAVQANPLLAGNTRADTNLLGACEGMEGGSCAMGWLQTSIGKVQFLVSYVADGDAERIISLTVARVPVVGVGLPDLAPSPP